MAVDVIGEMDAQEYDPTKFGLMEVSFFISDLFHFFILIQFELGECTFAYFVVGLEFIFYFIKCS